MSVPLAPRPAGVARLRAACAAGMACVALATSSPCAAAADTPPGRVTFPSDALTVADARQATGRRVNLPLPDCAVWRSYCDELRLVNELDGFDLDPRVTVRLEAPPAEPATLDTLLGSDTFFLQPAGGTQRIALNRLVYDPDAATVYAHPARQLREATTYRIVYAGGGRTSTATFTTMSASAGL
ncbi:MAG TPA: hypothetical protein VG452_03995, partial [Egibacteraceae bacterium]|nr:hypothetical protein [Egibacteraceae bacterium]